MPLTILFFADRLPPLTGGMEMHARYFIEHFSCHAQYPILGIITKDIEGNDAIVTEYGHRFIEIQDLPSQFDPSVVFFNSGRWIENLPEIRKNFPNAVFFYRTGGNEIIKAPLSNIDIKNHLSRQAYWVKNLNESIDFIITNSAYTEQRLNELGIICQYERCVGGVNFSELKAPPMTKSACFLIFSAARFVPYKNYFFFISVIQQLVLRGLDFQVRLAGDGPLLAEAKEQVHRNHLSETVKFLGVLKNEDVCREIAHANIYMQFSSDYMTEVPGGAYIHSEGMGRSILEALTAGTFVVAGRCGALPEVVTESNGLLVDIDDLVSVTDQVERIIKMRPKRNPQFDGYSWEKVFSRYEKLFRSVGESIACNREV